MFSIETKQTNKPTNKKNGKTGSLPCYLSNLKGESSYQLFYEYSHTHSL